MIGQVLAVVRVKDGDGFEIVEIEGVSGGEYPKDLEQYAAAGVDSLPLEGDSYVAVPVPGSDEWVIVGYLNTALRGVAKGGETRITARSALDTVVAHVYCRKDGSIELINDNGGIKLAPDGTINLNGVEITPDGRITDANGIELGAHGHDPGTYEAGANNVTGIAGEPTV